MIEEEETDDPTRKHKIPQKRKIFHARQLRLPGGLGGLEGPTSPSLTSFGWDRLIEDVKRGRPCQGSRSNEEVRADVNGETSGPAAKEIEWTLLTGAVLWVWRGRLEHGRLFSCHRIALNMPHGYQMIIRAYFFSGLWSGLSPSLLESGNFFYNFFWNKSLSKNIFNGLVTC